MTSGSVLQSRRNCMIVLEEGHKKKLEARDLETGFGIVIAKETIFCLEVM